MKTTRHLAIAAIVLGLAVAGALAWRSFARLDPAPDVAYTRLDGTQATTGQLKGKVVLVNFWATSCVTCIKEMPQIAATHLKYRDQGYDTLAVAMSYDIPARVSHFTQSRQLPFTVTYDASEDLARQFGDVQLTPTSVLIDRQGRIVKRYVGMPDFAAMNALIEKLLADG